MFGAIGNNTGAVRHAGRSTGNTKTTAYFQARAMDEALGGILSSTGSLYANGRAHPLLFGIMVERFWRLTGATADSAARGGFHVSDRERGSIRTREVLRVRKGNNQPVVERGPDEGFDDRVRLERQNILKALDEGNHPESWYFRVVFWNQQTGEGYDPRTPNLKDPRVEPSEVMKKGHDTAGLIEYFKPTDEQKTGMEAFLRQHLLSDEEAEAYKYTPPTNE